MELGFLLDNPASNSIYKDFDHTRQTKAYEILVRLTKSYDGNRRTFQHHNANEDLLQHYRAEKFV